MKKGNTTKLFVTVLAASIFLTGCQSADVDYNLNESQEEGQETEQESLSTLSQFSNLEPWNETFTIKTPEGKDGYMVTFELADDMGILMGENEGDYKEFMDLRSDRIPSLNVCVDVYVADEGVFDLRIENPVRVVNTTKISSFLSFDAIKNILRNSFEENLKKTYVISDAFANTQEKLYINSIELIYFRVKNPEKEGIYSYIPAWRFCRRMKVGGNEEKVIYSPVIINAIDGTVIDLKEQW